jgi:hypothetical protein
MDPTLPPRAPGASGAPRAPGASGGLDSLAGRAADGIDAFVVLLRDKTVRPATLAARIIIFGTIVLVASVVAVVSVSIAVIRLLTVYAFDGRVWLSDLVVGIVFVALGTVCWALRTGGGAKGAS